MRKGLSIFLLLLAWGVLLPLAESHACTVGTVHGSITTDGRPVMFKNRDNTPVNQQYMYYLDETEDPEISATYRFIGVGYTDDGPTMGLNEAGLAMGNSAAGPSGTHVSNRQFMYAVLRHCATIDEVRAYIYDTILPSSRPFNVSGCWPIIDAAGNAVLFEMRVVDSEPPIWVREYDAMNPAREQDGLLGMVPRGNTHHNRTDGRDNLGDTTHYRTARVNMQGLRDMDILDFSTIIQGSPDKTYEVLRHERYDGTANDIARSWTLGTIVVHGILPGEDPALTTMWTLLGKPNYCIAVPAWSRVSNIAPPMQDIGGTGDNIWTWTQSLHEKGQRETVHASTFPLESHHFDMVNTVLMPFWREHGTPPVADMERIHHQMAWDANSLLYCLDKVRNNNKAPEIGPIEIEDGAALLSFDFSITATDDVAVVSYAWDFGDGNTSNDSTPTHNYDRSGTYLVSCTVTDNEDVSITGWQYVVATCPEQWCTLDFGWDNNDLLTVAFEANALCPNDSVALVEWAFGDGYTGAGENPVHVYAAPGVYEVCVTVLSTTGCVDTVCDTVTVDADGCAAAFTWSEDGLEVGFTSTMDWVYGNLETISWNFGDGSGSTEEHPVHNYAVPGAYNVCLAIETSTGCTATHCETILFAPDACNADFDWTRTGELEVAFDADITWAYGPMPQIHWDFGDGTDSTGENPVHVYAVPGDYEVCLSIETSTGCAASQCETISFAPDACAAGFSWIHNGELGVAFDADIRWDYGDLESMMWDFGDGNTSTDESPEHVYAAPGAYEAGLTIVTSTGCIARHGAVVILDDVWCGARFDWSQSGLALTFEADIEAPYGSPTLIHWDFGDGATALGAAAAHVYPAPNTYQVRLRVETSTGCVAVYHKKIAVGESVPPVEGEAEGEGEPDDTCPSCTPPERRVFPPGATACLQVPGPVRANSTFHWVRSLGEFDPDRTSGIHCRTLEIRALVPEDSGIYLCHYGSGEKIQSIYPVKLTVQENEMPLATLYTVTALVITLAAMFFLSHSKERRKDRLKSGPSTHRSPANRRFRKTGR